jgi:hypothetical protein
MVKKISLSSERREKSKREETEHEENSVLSDVDRAGEQNTVFQVTEFVRKNCG